MIEVIRSVQEKLGELEALKYIDEDLGQLDYYSPNFPVKWPCALLDIISAGFEDVGKDRGKIPQQRQMGDAVLQITLANQKLSNTSSMAPLTQKNNARSIWQLMEEVHILLHGWRPEEKSGALLRRGFTRVKRDDGVQEYIIMYAFGMTDA